MQLSVELEREERWVPIGELTRLPGLVGVTREEALAAVEEIPSQRLEDERAEDPSRGGEVGFRVGFPSRARLKR
jgi:hypothetical protein